MQRFSPFVFAIFVSLLIVIAGLVHALKQHPPYAPLVTSEQQAKAALEREQSAEGGAHAKNDEHGGTHSEQTENQGTEFWPTFFGIRLKITDSLLAFFTGGLLVFTGLLWRSTDKLWGASLRQAELTQAALIGDQRAWVTTSLQIGSEGMTFRDDGIGIHISLQVTNVGRTAALRCHTNMRIVVDFAELADDVKRFCEENKIRNADHGRLTAANETYLRPWRLSATNKEIYQYGRRDGIFPIVIGCVTYEILQDDLIHQTAFAYSLALDDGNAFGTGIRREDGDLVAEQLLVLTAPGGFTT
jgi:hypothetical protein